MTTTTQIIADFVALYEGKDEEVSLTEMKKSLSEVYKAVSSGKKKSTKKTKGDDEASDKPKRAATAYNLFMKEQMEKLKEEGSSLTGKEKMQKIAELWKQAKAFSSSDEEAVAADDEKEAVVAKSAGKASRKSIESK